MAEKEESSKIILVTCSLCFLGLGVEFGGASYKYLTRIFPAAQEGRAVLGAEVLCSATVNICPVSVFETVKILVMLVCICSHNHQYKALKNWYALQLLSANIVNTFFCRLRGPSENFLKENPVTTVGLQHFFLYRIVQ
ncbi:hypothetical protein V5799_011766 [Amblyomma americanum]|uniref:Uncharacterized protein n=1 Tax=Amblyomma americanum TaxID=6943 RepID=A0AAQ4EGA6_AMBAM